MKFLKTATMTCLVCALTLIGLTVFDSEANAQRGGRRGTTVVAQPGATVNVRNNNGGRFAAGPAGLLAPRGPLGGIKNLVRNVLGGALNLANEVVGGNQNLAFRNNLAVTNGYGYGYNNGVQNIQFLNTGGNYHGYHGYHGANQALLLNQLNTFGFNNLVNANLNSQYLYTPTQPIIVAPSTIHGYQLINPAAVTAPCADPTAGGVNYLTTPSAVTGGTCCGGASTIVSPGGAYYIRRY